MGHTFHPLVWPIWALGAALAVSHNPLHNLLLMATIALVVRACHTDGSLGRGFGLFWRLGLVLIAIRVGLSTVAVGGLSFGATPMGRLPQLELPIWAGGIVLGGPFTLEMIAHGLVSGLRLMTLLLVFGAFNAVADQYGLLRRTPRWLFGAGLVVTIALAWVPQTLIQFQAVREAQRLRGQRRGGWRSVPQLVIPMLTGGLERAWQLAEAMDSRGYGRSARPVRWNGAVQAGLLLGVVLLALGVFAVLGYAQVELLGWCLSAAGCLVLILTIRILSRSVNVTRYVHERWLWRDWAVVIVVGLVVLTIRVHNPLLLAYTVFPKMTLPPFSPLIGGLLVFLSLPAWLVREPRRREPLIEQSGH